jgi:hypothetical protein
MMIERKSSSDESVRIAFRTKTSRDENCVIACAVMKSHCYFGRPSGVGFFERIAIFM